MLRSKYRNRVLALLSLLLVITYLDRVCISVAGPRMQEALHISPEAWGWVTGIFTISYAAFEIPNGVLGDRIGPRRVLTRIVLWWSGFTTLTGLVSGYYPLLLTRFLFGAGEAGAYPNAGIVVGRWFPVHERGRAFGIILMASQLGGAIAPLLVVPIQMYYGWRASFFVFGIAGVLWSGIWYWRYRDTPAEKPGVSEAELDETRGSIARAHQKLPWTIALTSMNFWAALGVALCYVYTFYFFQSWFHTYLVNARGYSEKNLLLSSLPFFVAACANFAGGLVSNALVKKVGLKWGRCSIGAISLSLSALCTVAVMFTAHQLAAMILLSLVYAGITFQQPIMFAVCLDIGGPYAGAMVGAMNTSAQIGSFVSSLAFGYLVGRFGNYNLPFIPMAILLLIGAVLWLKVDPTKQLVKTQSVEGALPATANEA
ncbi:MAG TPA: MFS transporter [Steroidobacteraceae bacterium]|jgi:ACS family glucarate transporter-like MFS transporter|nr:MFS transporter [Steroidobacteraceae bacterium]